MSTSPEQNLSENLSVIEHAPWLAALDGTTTRAVRNEHGDATIEIRTAAGTWASLGGRNPEAEAARRLRSLPPDAPLVFVIGLGLGHFLEAIEHADVPTRIIALEPDPGIAALFLSRRSWRSWLESGRLRLLVGPDYSGASTLCRYVDTADPPPVLVDPVMAVHRRASVIEAQRVMARMVREGQANQEARRRFAGPYLLQTLANLPVIAGESNVDALQNAFSGMPAVVIGAGPSLDRNLPDLARVGNRAVLISADTALRTLLTGGVRPHVVVGLDPGELNASHLAISPTPDDVWLVGEGSLHPHAFHAFAGRTFVFQVSHHQPWPWIGTLGLERGTLRAWGSVITSAFDLALRLGCNPIIFAGLDLAYTNGQTYCRGTVFEHTWQSWVDRGFSLEEVWQGSIRSRPMIELTDVNGAPTLSAPHLVAFRDWLADRIAADGSRTFINATGAGVLAGPGITLGSLGETLASYLVLGDDVRRTLAERHVAGCAGAPERAALRHALALIDETAEVTPSEVIEAWQGFTFGNASAEEIVGALRRAINR